MQHEYKDDSTGLNRIQIYTVKLKKGKIYMTKQDRKEDVWYTGNPCAKLGFASQAYQKGCTCSQAVFAAFSEDMGLDQDTACRIMEGFGGGFGGKQEVCGAFSAAAAVISYYFSSGSMDGKSKARTYQAIRRAAEIYEQEYGSINCREILHGNSPKAFQCGMKVKDAVLMVGKVLAESAEELSEIRKSREAQKEAATV